MMQGCPPSLLPPDPMVSSPPSPPFFVGWGPLS